MDRGNHGLFPVSGRAIMHAGPVGRGGRGPVSKALRARSRVVGGSAVDDDPQVGGPIVSAEWHRPPGTSTRSPARAGRIARGERTGSAPSRSIRREPVVSRPPVAVFVT